MNFTQATNRLIEPITLEDVAEEVGVSHGTLRQSRLDRSNAQHRTPPEGWEAAVVKIAERRAADLRRLAEQLAARARNAGRTGRGRRGAAERPAGRKKSRSH